ncbi:F-box/LRR-repeat protein At3g48880-like [Zingiber officinale]|uniref:F-box/LRR-repeat protein At3g48880-like n=1 Tax=Zingiber officinale TaxID=94328 RepID=UPI001C4C984A|nr:F-box/LRR-repeat protein At3g48880-like [Zingiber officinale]
MARLVCNVRESEGRENNTDRRRDMVFVSSPSLSHLSSNMLKAIVEEELDRHWDEMQADCLINIFRRLALGDLAVAVPFVCKSWYRASLDPSCWCRLNFRSFDFTPWSPFSCAFALRYHLHSPLSFSAFLCFSLHRSRGVVDQLTFPLSSAVSIHNLAYASVKCPRLKALALPDNLMLEDDLRIPELVRRWKDLEHLEMETKPSSFLEAVAEIGHNCPRFVGLKVRGLIGREDAKALARCLPELKHLELSKSYLTKDELLVVIGGCRKLETLTVKDCLRFQADDEILKLVSCIERFEHEGSTLLDDYGYEIDESEQQTGFFHR